MTARPSFKRTELEARLLALALGDRRGQQPPPLYNGVPLHLSRGTDARHSWSLTTTYQKARRTLHSRAFAIRQTLHGPKLVTTQRDGRQSQCSRPRPCKLQTSRGSTCRAARTVD